MLRINLACFGPFQNLDYEMCILFEKELQTGIKKLTIIHCLLNTIFFINLNENLKTSVN